MLLKPLLLNIAHVVLLSFGIFAILYSSFNQIYCKNNVLAKGMLSASTVVDKEKVSEGYTLITPLGGKTVYLVDMFGKPVHIWKTQNPAFYAKIDKNGDLIVALVASGDNGDFPAGGRNGIIQVLNWDSEVLWEYKNEMLHHDFDILPNGNIVAIVWEKLPKDVAQKVKGGVSGTEFNGNIWSDRIIEISKNKDIVWSWHLHEHLDLIKDKLGPLTPRAELGHSNSIMYVENDPLRNTEAYLISVRLFNTVMLVKKATGEVIWQSPKGILAYQHDATLTSNGNILVFDNNLNREPDPRPQQGSQVVEMNLRDNKVVWKFSAGETPTEKTRFKADIVSGAQRLPNGNTLIINGTTGYLFEVTPESKLVWDFISPFSTDTTGPWLNTFIFKARRYMQSEISWPEKLGSPIPIASLVCTRAKDLF